MADFIQVSNDDHIEVRYGTDKWGPWAFDFSGALPNNDQISSVNVRAFFGKIKPRDLLSEKVEITPDLIDPEYTPELWESNTKVLIKLQYPGDQYKGKATIIFEVTTVSGGKHPFYFDRVVIS